MARNICILGSGATADEAERRSCQDRSHFHMRTRDVSEGVNGGRFEWLIPGEVARLAGTYPKRGHGLSCIVGPYLAERVQRGEPLARVIVAEILKPRPR